MEGKFVSFIIGSNIKRMRSSLKWTQDMLAEKLGKTRQTISSYEQGISAPKLQELVDLATVLNCSVSDLLNEKNLAPNNRGLDKQFSPANLENKPADSSRFGNEVEEFLREQIREKDHTIRVLLEKLGKRKVYSNNQHWNQKPYIFLGQRGPTRVHLLCQGRN